MIGLNHNMDLPCDLQESKIMLEAGPVYEALSLPPTHKFDPPAAGPEAHKVHIQAIMDRHNGTALCSSAECISSPPPPPVELIFPQVIYELRSYQLHPGYGSVPKLLEAFRKG